AGAQLEVIDCYRRGAPGAVRSDGRRGPERRLRNRTPYHPELLRLSIDDQVFAIRYGATRVRTYLAIMSNSRLTRSPMRAVPSVVRRKVSGMSAAAKLDSSGSTTVSETPSIAIEPLLTTSSANSGGKLQR